MWKPNYLGNFSMPVTTSGNNAVLPVLQVMSEARVVTEQGELQGVGCRGSEAAAAIHGVPKPCLPLLGWGRGSEPRRCGRSPLLPSAPIIWGGGPVAPAAWTQWRKGSDTRQQVVREVPPPAATARWSHSWGSTLCSAALHQALRFREGSADARDPSLQPSTWHRVSTK